MVTKKEILQEIQMEILTGETLIKNMAFSNKELESKLLKMLNDGYKKLQTSLGSEAKDMFADSVLNEIGTMRAKVTTIAISRKVQEVRTDYWKEFHNPAFLITNGPVVHEGETYSGKVELVFVNDGGEEYVSRGNVFVNPGKTRFQLEDSLIQDKEKYTQVNHALDFFQAYSENITVDDFAKALIKKEWADITPGKAS